MDAEVLREEVGRLHWFHTIDLGQGVITPGTYRVNEVDVQRMGIPERLYGKSVLDIGAWDGFWSFLCKQRGAERVLATDSYCWSERSPTSKAGFELARRALALDVEDQFIDVMELASEKVGTFDLVLFLGVLYHLRDPITAIERAASVAADQLILETETAVPWLRRSGGLLFVNDELAGDDTNWWALNVPALLRLLRRFGFRRVEVYSRLNPWQRLRRAGPRHWTPETHRAFVTRLRSQRTVLHAWK